MKVALTGHGQCGKDHAAEYLSRHTPLVYRGSLSWAALPLMADHLELAEQTAWEQRSKHRNEWKKYLRYLKRGRPLLLVEMLVRKGATIITGLRDYDEAEAAHQRGWRIIWIDAVERVPRDITVDDRIQELADEEWHNNKDVNAFNEWLQRWAMDNGLWQCV